MAMSAWAGRPQSLRSQPMISLPSCEAMVTFAPASFSLSRGTSSSACSKPLVAMIKILASRIAGMKNLLENVWRKSASRASVRPIRNSMVLEIEAHFQAPQQHHHQDEDHNPQTDDRPGRA